MIYTIFCVGKIKDTFYRDEIVKISNEIKKRGHIIEILEFPDEKIPENLKEKNKQAFLAKECARMYEKMQKKDYVIALCIEGKQITTKQHVNYVQMAKEDGFSRIVYVIGGSLGLSDQIKKRANLKMSFSKMTFPHQMIRMVLCEEILNTVNK